MRYYKGYIALSEACDVPILLHIRNARAICFDQLFELISLEMEAPLVRSLRWRVARLAKCVSAITRAGRAGKRRAENAGAELLCENTASHGR